MTEQRLTWIQQWSRRQVTADEDDTLTDIIALPEFTYEDLDDAFLEERCSMEMIQDWLQDCSSPSIENPSEDKHQSHIKGKVNSFEDDFNLGAEAILLFDSYESSSWSGSSHSRAKSFNLNNSMTSTRTTKTCSSVSDILTLYQKDPEDILYNLGFAIEDPCTTLKIPIRFFSYHSHASGIDFKVFIHSQMQRMEVENHTFIQTCQVKKD